MDTSSIAVQFVDLALKYEWNMVEELPAEEMETLQKIIVKSGFKDGCVVRGKIEGHYLDQEGRKTVETYPVNTFCPFKVVNPDGDDEIATSFLDDVLKLVVPRIGEEIPTREQFIERVQEKINQAISLKPIQLTSAGDFLVKHLPTFATDHPQDGELLRSCVGMHQYCGGWLDRHRATATHDAISCRECNLRVLIPREVETYGDLREALASQWKEGSV